MKITAVIFPMILTFAMSLPSTAQQTYYSTAGNPSDIPHPTGELETSMIVASVETPHMDVWLMNRRIGVIISRDENGNLQGLTGETQRNPTDRFFIMLYIKDPTMAKKIGDARATVAIISPSDESISFDLARATGGLGSPLTLSEKGEYRFTVNLHAGTLSRKTQFRYSINRGDI